MKKRPLVTALGAALAAAGWYGWRIEPRWLRVVHLTLPVSDLPPAFDGYRIAHLSDLHLGVPLTQDHLPDVIQAVNREHPDLIAITGDVATGQRDGLADGRDQLANLHALDGVWACTGNHDFFVGVEAVTAALAGAGIGLLRNDHHVIARGPDRLVIAGVDDMVRGVANLGAALNGAPENSPVILLAHEPDFARIAIAEPRIILQLSGHTHGGQIRLPGLGAPVLPKLGQLYPAGAYRIGAMALYVTHGTGTGRFVMRFNCRPEIAFITLRRGAAQSTDGTGPVWRELC
ncbi:MAG: metallophosphoesterase [Anaerolineae bacterium]|nr:metallophosphoesterase [Anaerolineae bacterium]